MTSRSTVDSNILVETNRPLVTHMVRQAMGRVPARGNRDDPTSADILALVQARRS